MQQCLNWLFMIHNAATKEAFRTRNNSVSISFLVLKEWSPNKWCFGMPVDSRTTSRGAEVTASQPAIVRKMLNLTCMQLQMLSDCYFSSFDFYIHTYSNSKIDSLIWFWILTNALALASNLLPLSLILTWNKQLLWIVYFSSDQSTFYMHGILSQYLNESPCMHG